MISGAILGRVESGGPGQKLRKNAAKTTHAMTETIIIGAI
jgi:hypothetical protein